ncbi:hypothetical protein L7F22_037762 [Adiantum nelumboides]|nr:hypothetical protein [Adiantum nelumboides]
MAPFMSSRRALRVIVSRARHVSERKAFFCTHTLARFPHPVSMVNGASRGLGLALTEKLLTKHPDSPVIATCRNPDSAEGLTALKEKFSSQLTVLRLDVTMEDTMEAVAKEISSRYGRLDMLVSTSGILHIPDQMEPEPKLVNVEPKNLMLAYRVNAVGPILVAKHMMPLLKTGLGEGTGREGAVVANITCKMASLRDNLLGGWYAYRASKASLNQCKLTANFALLQSTVLIYHIMLQRPV